jgi:hypothetical protein
MHHICNTSLGVLRSATATDDGADSNAGKCAFRFLWPRCMLKSLSSVDDIWITCPLDLMFNLMHDRECAVSREHPSLWICPVIVECLVHVQVDRIARVGFETARKRGGKLCSVDKANVLEVIKAHLLRYLFQAFSEKILACSAAQSVKLRLRSFDWDVDSRALGTSSEGYPSHCVQCNSSPGYFETRSSVASDLSVYQTGRNRSQERELSKPSRTS